MVVLPFIRKQQYGNEALGHCLDTHIPKEARRKTKVVLGEASTSPDKDESCDAGRTGFGNPALQCQLYLGY